MARILPILAMVLVAVGLALSLSHALELPGKLRLGKDAYLSTQAIYYPGFTVGGAFEPLAILATLALAFVTPYGDAAFGLVLVALAALVIAHAIYWVLIHPINKVWLRDRELEGAGRSFFSVGGKGPISTEDWTVLRDRWEYSHVARAGLTLVSLAALAGAVVC